MTGAVFDTRYVIVKFTQPNKYVCNLLGIPSTEDTMNVVILQTGCQSKPGAHLFSTDSVGVANEWSSSLNSTNSITNSGGQSGNVSVNNSGKVTTNNYCANVQCLFYFLKVWFLFLCTSAVVNIRQLCLTGTVSLNRMSALGIRFNCVLFVLFCSWFLSLDAVF